MAERAAKSGRTRLRGMRKHRVTAAHSLAHDRCNQIEISILSSKASNTRSAFPPEGSVLQNDIKQQLAKERREEKRRQQDATKEILLEKERKSRIHYEKQMEEKQRKLQEQKQKDEQRRICAEEKRKQKLREDREKFKSALSHTVEQSNRIERLKRWSLDGSNSVNPESKTANRRLISSEKLELGTSGSHKKTNVSSSGVHNFIAKDIQTPVLRYTTVPLSSNHLKNTIMLCKSTVTMPPQEKVETPLGVNLQAPPEASLAGASEVSVAQASEVSVETTPKLSVEAFSESSETSVKGSKDVSLASMDPSLEVSMKISFGKSKEVFQKATMDTIPEENSEAILTESMEKPSETSMEPSPELCCEVTVETSPEMKVTATPQKSSSVNKKPPLPQIPYTRWPTSANLSCSPSHFSAGQIQKNCLPSISPCMSKQSAQLSVSCETIPAQQTLCTQNLLGAINSEEVVSKTAESSEAVCQKHVSNEESGDKSTQGIMNAEEATKISAAKLHPACEQREEEKVEEEMEQRKEEDETKKVIEGQEEFSKFDNEQPQTELKKESYQDQESQKMLLQEEDTKTKTQEEDCTHKKEQEIIMLKDLQERLERIKVARTSIRDLCREQEAEDKSEAFVKSMTSSAKLRTGFRSMKKTPRLLFLDVNSDKILTKPRSSLKRKVKARKFIRLSTRIITNQLTKTRKTTETSNTMVPYEDLYTLSPESICEQILEDADSETAVSRIFPCGQNQSPEGLTAFHQSPQTPLDDKDRNESDSACSDV
ncbi:MAP7 domain-containing protein 3 isoform X2 [Saccopteryx bilineata]|uniref:MAP7 domain-containing protein 3 isoform X2 n=1 Tax=Saccopteryx bilineata TaxID=59482 RepID=UPI00338FFDC9